MKHLWLSTDTWHPLFRVGGGETPNFVKRYVVIQQQHVEKPVRKLWVVLKLWWGGELLEIFYKVSLDVLDVTGQTC